MEGYIEVSSYWDFQGYGTGGADSIGYKNATGDGCGCSSGYCSDHFIGDGTGFNIENGYGDYYASGRGCGDSPGAGYHNEFCEGSG